MPSGPSDESRAPTSGARRAGRLLAAVRPLSRRDADRPPPRISASGALPSPALGGEAPAAPDPAGGSEQRLRRRRAISDPLVEAGRSERGPSDPTSEARRGAACSRDATSFDRQPDRPRREQPTLGVVSALRAMRPGTAALARRSKRAAFAAPQKFIMSRYGNNTSSTRGRLALALRRRGGSRDVHMKRGPTSGGGGKRARLPGQRGVLERLAAGALRRTRSARPQMGRAQPSPEAAANCRPTRGRGSRPEEAARRWRLEAG